MTRERTRYKVGYKKPPKETQFKPGQSGNPRGRTKGSKNTYDILKNELDTRITLKEGGKEIILTKKQALLRHLINKAIQGDIKSMLFVFQQLLLIEAKDSEMRSVMEDISEEDNKILMRFLQENLEISKQKKEKKGEKNK